MHAKLVNELSDWTSPLLLCKCLVEKTAKADLVDYSFDLVEVHIVSHIVGRRTKIPSHMVVVDLPMSNKNKNDR
jgi:hypothetical protein